MKNKELIGSLLLLLILSPLFIIGMVLMMFLVLGEVLAEALQRRSLKFLLWKLNVRQSCPYCGATMTKHGFEPDERYTCDNEGCEFNAD